MEVEMQEKIYIIPEMHRKNMMRVWFLKNTHLQDIGQAS